MRMTFALSGNGKSMMVINQERPQSLLSSFAYKSTLKKLEFVPEYLLIDSGAFTAWNSGKAVKVDHYRDYCLMVKDRIPHARYINLDVIPGEAGRDSTPEERERGMEESLRNADFLRASGLDVMEVFHQDEPFSFLDELVARLPGPDSILCLSPRNDVSVQARAAWLKQVLRHLLKTRTLDQLPRTHGLAATASGMLSAFPFFSADSSSWTMAYSYGRYSDPRTMTMKAITTAYPGSRLPAVQNHATRQSIKALLRLEREMTAMWQARGIQW